MKMQGEQYDLFSMLKEAFNERNVKPDLEIIQVLQQINSIKLNCSDSMKKLNFHQLKKTIAKNPDNSKTVHPRKESDNYDQLRPLISEAAVLFEMTIKKNDIYTRFKEVYLSSYLKRMKTYLAGRITNHEDLQSIISPVESAFLQAYQNDFFHTYFTTFIHYYNTTFKTPRKNILVYSNEYIQMKNVFYMFLKEYIVYNIFEDLNSNDKVYKNIIMDIYSFYSRFLSSNYQKLRYLMKEKLNYVNCSTEKFTSASQLEGDDSILKDLEYLCGQLIPTYLKFLPSILDKSSKTNVTCFKKSCEIIQKLGAELHQYVTTRLADESVSNPDSIIIKFDAFIFELYHFTFHFDDAIEIKREQINAIVSLDVGMEFVKLQYLSITSPLGLNNEMTIEQEEL